MKSRKIAIKGIIVLLCAITICIFFSGTIKSIVTPQVRLVTIRNGRLTHYYEFTGQFIFPNSEPYYHKTNQQVVVDEVYIHPGDSIKRGDLLFSLRIPNAAETEAQLKRDYHDALLSRLSFEQTYAEYDVDPRFMVYLDAKNALESAVIREGDAAIDVQRIFPENVTIPDEGYPDGTSEEGKRAIDAWRQALAIKQIAQITYDEATANYTPCQDDILFYSQDYETTKRIKDTGASLNAFIDLQDSLRCISALNDCTVAEIYTQKGSLYDDTAPMCLLMDSGTVPVIEIITDDINQVIPPDTLAEIITPWGNFDTVVTESGLNTTGNYYAYLAIPEQLAAIIHSYAQPGNIGISVCVNLRNDLQTALIPVSAVHGSGNKRYVYMATERSNVLGAPDLIITPATK